MIDKKLGFRRKIHKLQCPQWVLSMAYSAMFWSFIFAAYSIA